MAATRIIDENQSELEEIESVLMKRMPMANDPRTKMVNDAYLFMRDEVSHRLSQAV